MYPMSINPHTKPQKNTYTSIGHIWVPISNITHCIISGMKSNGLCDKIKICEIWQMHPNHIEFVFVGKCPINCNCKVQNCTRNMSFYPQKDKTLDQRKKYIKNKREKIFNRWG